MKKIIALLFAVVTAFAFSSCGKDDDKKDDSYSATVITLDATNICADSACLNAKIIYRHGADCTAEVGICVNSEPSCSYDNCITASRKEVNELEGTMELHDVYKHLSTSAETLYYCAYFRVISGDKNEFVYGDVKSYAVPQR